MIYELRIYRCVPGRKPALLSRFENRPLGHWGSETWIISDDRRGQVSQEASSASAARH